MSGNPKGIHSRSDTEIRFQAKTTGREDVDPYLVSFQFQGCWPGHTFGIGEARDLGNEVGGATASTPPPGLSIDSLTVLLLAEIQGRQRLWSGIR